MALPAALCLAALMSLGLPAAAQPVVTAARPPVTAAQPWVSFDALAAPPAVLDTKIPASVALVPGPEGRRALAVTVPDMGRDERACAFSLPLPALPGPTNGVRLWLKAQEPARRLEVALRGPAGTYGAEVDLGPAWREIVLSAGNTHPLLGTTGGSLDLAPGRVTQVRFCFGEWLGYTGGPHTISVGPITAVQSPLLTPPPPVQVRRPTGLQLPAQSFTLELSDLCRGEWDFADAFGQYLSLPGPVTAYAQVAGPADGPLKLAYLCCDPEFPDDPVHATLRVADAAHTEGPESWFRVAEPCFSCLVRARRGEGGLVTCELSDLHLGPALPGDSYVAAVYVADAASLAGKGAGPLSPLRLFPSAEATLRLTTARVGNVFVGDDRPTVILTRVCNTRQPEVSLSVEVTDYARGDVVWRGTVKMPARAPGLQVQSLPLPLTRRGIFQATVAGAGAPATVRLCRLPAPRAVPPDASSMGINLFQQQVWWYAYQVPLMAQAGVHWIRPWLAWENTWSLQQPTPQQWETRPLDAALRRMERYGQRYAIILWGAPSWALGSIGGPAPGPDKMNLWAEYVRRLVKQYRGRSELRPTRTRLASSAGCIPAYEIWNEPDGMWPEPTRHQGEHYMALLKAAWREARQADPGCNILAPSHAGYEEWLERVGALGLKDYLDTVSIHVYADPRDFLAQVEQRREILRRHGMGDKPLWINELGTTAYDFNADYSKEYGCSEQRQAAVLVADYALALSVDPRMKAFWFCTVDPRDAAHRSGWTGDAGIGVLYLGLLPKLSYAALAGVAQQLDGRRCLGEVAPGRSLRQVSFDGPLAVVWDDDAQPGRAVPACDFGCAPGERVTVQDMFTNVLTSGKAAEVTVDLTRGPVYLSGSRRMAGMARANAHFTVRPEALSMTAGHQARAEVQAPARATVSVDVPADLPLTAHLGPPDAQGRRRLSLVASAAVPRASGVVTVSLAPDPAAWDLGAPATLRRSLVVTVGEPNLIRDGGFRLPALLAWTPQRTSAYSRDDKVGHAEPGSLRLDAPFDRRLVHWGITLKPGQPARLRAWVKTRGLQGALVSLNVALFAADHWLQTFCLAATEPVGELEGGWRAVPRLGHIPTGDADWTLVEATLPVESIPRDTATAAFFLDASRGGQGTVWLDDLDLWQPRD